MFGSALRIYKKLGYRDETTGTKFGIIEMDLADSSLKAYLDNK